MDVLTETETHLLPNGRVQLLGAVSSVTGAMTRVEWAMLIIAGSGMCTGGRVISHLIELLPGEQHCVLFVGHQARGTLGRTIQSAARSGGRVRISGQDVPVRARIETLSGLSAHADRGELLRWLQALPAPRRIALHHGEPEAQAAFAKFAAGVR